MNEIQTKINNHFPLNKEIPIESIEIREEVRSLCEKNQCGNYNKNWTCPPAVGSLEECKDKMTKYKRIIVVYDIYQYKNAFDFKGMMDGGKDFSDRLLELKNDITKDKDAMFLGAGGCRLCEKCAYIDAEKCRRPDDAIISCEAHGIDVMALMKNNGIKYNNGKNTVTYVGAVLY